MATTEINTRLGCGFLSAEVGHSPSASGAIELERTLRTSGQFHVPVLFGGRHAPVALGRKVAP